MDAHFLTPSSPQKSIVVFAGPADDAERQTPYARALHLLGCRAGAAEPVYLDVQTTGTLADLARARADLAIIALPPDEVAAAMEVAARIGCRAVLIIGSGLDAERCAQLQRIARRENVHLLGPNSLGFQRPSLGLNASAAARCHWRFAGPGVAVRRAHRLDAGLGAPQPCGFQPVVSIGPDAAVDLAGAGLPRHRCARPRHRGLPRRHRQRPPFHERAALGRACQAGGGAQGPAGAAPATRPR